MIVRQWANLYKSMSKEIAVGLNLKATSLVCLIYLKLVQLDMIMENWSPCMKHLFRTLGWHHLEVLEVSQVSQVGSNAWDIVKAAFWIGVLAMGDIHPNLSRKGAPCGECIDFLTDLSSTWKEPHQRVLVELFVVAFAHVSSASVEGNPLAAFG